MKISSDGRFVITASGRIGLAVDDKPHHTLKGNVITIQFGAGGPFHDAHEKSLRYATEQEVRDAGLWGVGGMIGPPVKVTCDETV